MIVRNLVLCLSLNCSSLSLTNWLSMAPIEKHYFRVILETCDNDIDIYINIHTDTFFYLMLTQHMSCLIALQLVSSACVKMLPHLTIQNSIYAGAPLKASSPNITNVPYIHIWLLALVFLKPTFPLVSNRQPWGPLHAGVFGQNEGCDPDKDRCVWLPGICNTV